MKNPQNTTICKSCNFNFKSNDTAKKRIRNAYINEKFKIISRLVFNIVKSVIVTAIGVLVNLFNIILYGDNLILKILGIILGFAGGICIYFADINILLEISGFPTSNKLSMKKRVFLFFISIICFVGSLLIGIPRLNTHDA